MSATSLSDSGATAVAACRTAVFRPEKEKSGCAEPFIGRGKAKRAGSPSLRRALDIRPARIGQAEHLGRLVEGLAERVVDRRGPALVVADPAHQHDLRVAAGDEQQQIGEVEPVGQPRRQRVAFEMVDRKQRLAGGAAIAFAVISPTISPPTRPGPAVAAIASTSASRIPGIGKRRLDDAVQRLDMGARRDLRHHAAEGRMLLDLAEHDVGQDLRLGAVAQFDHARRGLVATRLDAENADHLVAPFDHCRPGVSSDRRLRAKPGSPVLLTGGYHGPRHANNRAEDRNARQPAGAGAGARDARPADGGARPAGRSLRDRGDLDQRRPHPGPAAVGSRRQGPVHQGDRGSAARRPHRHRRAFLEGHADRAAGGLGALRLPAARGSARRLHRHGGEVDRGTARGRDGRLVVAAPAGADPPAAARSQGRDLPRQCADAAAQAG